MSVVTVMISTPSERSMSATQGSVSATRTSMCRLEGGEVAYTSLSEAAELGLLAQNQYGISAGHVICAAPAVNASNDVKVV